MTKLPLSIREVRPFHNAVLLTGVRPDGLPDGFHTGGAYEYEDRVYKPLDGRPFPNADYHYPTLEETVLNEMAGQPLFPKNWTVETLNGRRFLVRKKAIIIGNTAWANWHDLGLHRVLEIEQGIRNLNAHHWEVNDLISIGFDRDTDALFVVDMSAAQKMSASANAAWRADDYIRLERLFEFAGLTWIKNRRSAAHHELIDATCNQDHPAYTSFGKMHYQHVYGSFNRPVSLLWADKLKPFDVQFKHQLMDFEKGVPLTWIFTTQPLPQEILDSYELEWLWSPIPYLQGDEK